jgi:penicillin-binding protein 2
MKQAILILTLIGLLAGCRGSPAATATTTSKPYTLPPTVAPPAATATATATPLPPADAAAAAFLDDWEAGDYVKMYTQLSPDSQAAIGAESFVQRYQDALYTATVLTVTTRLRAALQEGDQARVAFDLALDTALVGTLTADVVMPLSLHDGRWLVDWDAGLIWPQLAGENYFRMEYIIPIRANIYDRDGLGLATEGTIVTVGVIPGQIEDEDALLEALEFVTELAQDEIRGRYVAAPADWKVPIADILAETSVAHNNLLASTPGIYREEKESRIYSHGAVAPHVIGWVAPVPAEQLEAYHDRGYRGNEWVGVSGLEAWGEEILAGQHGGLLAVVASTGEQVAEVAERPATPSRAIYTTFDRDFHEKVKKILGGRRGVIVALDVHSGAVLALASGPGFDSNVFVGPAGAVGRSQILADPNRPLFNRATQGTYPSGSVFKIVTLATALERTAMDPDQTFFDCPGYWEGLGAEARKDCWKEDGHGHISLKDGLTASCNVVFYTVGQRLDELGQDMLPQFARGFGFGEPTGLVGVLEEDGLVPDPEWKMNDRGEAWGTGDTVNLAIGQGNLAVTPLQMARMMAAVANGGTLYRPYVVGRIAAGSAAPEQVTQPEVVGTLPISPEHLAVLQEALLGVTTSSIGTATRRFVGLGIPVAGKTGTAEVGGPDTEPHSWFAAYAPAGSPEIALVVMVENAGEGSTVAAPLARQVIEAYYDLRLSPLPPQAEEGYVPPTATPTPTPQP